MGTGLYEQLELTLDEFQVFHSGSSVDCWYSTSPCFGSRQKRSHTVFLLFLASLHSWFPWWQSFIHQGQAARLQIFLMECFDMIVSRHTSKY